MRCRDMTATSSLITEREDQPRQPSDDRDQSNEDRAIDPCEQCMTHGTPCQLLWQWIAAEEGQSHGSAGSTEQ
jgi:hypothetical protein